MTGHDQTHVSPILRLSDPLILFRTRARRFRHLAQAQPSLTGYLNLMAGLAERQHDLAQTFPCPSPPDSGTAKPPLGISQPFHDPAWREALRTLVQGFAPGTGPLAGLLDRIGQAADTELDEWADRLLAADFGNLDPGLAPFLAAALQVRWTAGAARLATAGLAPAEPAYRCPVCGSLPVASVLHAGGPAPGLRYLCCALCASEWNRVRIHCVHCGSGKDVAYYGIEGAGAAVKAEACDACGCYIKIMNREKDPGLDPHADDLATLALDLLMAEAGYARLGFNPFLVPGT